MNFKELNARAHIAIDRKKPLRLYMRSAEMLLKQAAVYDKEQDYVNAYILYMKYSTLVVTEFPKHPDYPKENVTKLRNNCITAMDSLERIKPLLETFFKKQELLIKEKERLEKQKEEERVKAEQERIRFEKEQAYQQQMEMERIEQERVRVEQQKILEERQRQDSTQYSQIDLLENPERLSQTLRNPVYTNTAVAYPGNLQSSSADHTTNYISPSNNFQTTYNSSYTTPSFNSLPPPISAPVYQPSLVTRANILSEPNRITNLPIPQNITLPQVAPKPTVQDTPPPVPTKPVQETMVSPTGGPLRTVTLPESLVSHFLQISAKNTKNNLETCGILCGILKLNKLHVNTLLIPPQTATSGNIKINAA
ncbi:hypothetical protein HK103_003767 [Boothiomyces macroporosus]|uniref:USP8 dimerisation domain-containing protein n=1 Tax=Boothiomyces macroporosus TaxID=261099 RepID=A0AAD5UJX5_9FUNG|nr:hypothetical protein HK103_003767 [Boothiomyces macroporosus]